MDIVCDLERRIKFMRSSVVQGDQKAAGEFQDVLEQLDNSSYDAYLIKYTFFKEVSFPLPIYTSLDKAKVGYAECRDRLEEKANKKPDRYYFYENLSEQYCQLLNVSTDAVIESIEVIKMKMK